MLYRIFKIVMLILVISSVATAQYGKIAGRVVDRETGEPLIGANVLILGTTLGAATDINGRYVIHNVPPGLYDIRASYVGYQDMTIREVRVTAGLTQEVNFELVSTAIATEPITVVAERPLIEKSATNVVRIIKAEEFDKLPVRGIGAYVAIQPGVVYQNGQFHIRGGRSDEVGYMVEGADVRNVVSRGGGSLVSVIPDAVEEILIQAGGYSAEFGNANSGIVQQNFKTGTERYKISLRAETDNFGNYPGKKFLGTYSYGYSDYVVTLSGPLFTRRIKLFLSGENYFIRDYSPMFFEGSPKTWSDGTPFDTVYDTGALGGEKGDWQILKWEPGNIPGRFRNRYTFNGTALLDFKPLLIRLAGAFTWQRQRSNGPHIINLFALERLPITDQNNLLLNLKFTYFLTSTSFLEVNLNYLDRRVKTYDPYFKDEILKYVDSLEAAKYGWEYPEYHTPPRPYDFYGFPFNRPGSPVAGYGKDHWNYYGGSAAITAQIGRHEFKVGGSFQRWTVRHYGVGRLAGLWRTIRSNPDSVRDVETLINFIRRKNALGFNVYGFDELGRKVDSGPNRPRHPVFASVYVQDKIEFDDIIINVGARFDYIDMDTWKFKDPTRPEYDPNTFLLKGIEKGSTFSFVSPRIGFSFPVTDRTVFHLQYGKFIQAPGLDVAFRGQTYAASILRGGYAFRNPVAYDLKPTRTTQYEAGFTHQFTDFASFDITAFYKDIRNQVQYSFQRTQAGWYVGSYPVFINQDFATTKGIEFRLTMRRINRLQAQINYTLSDSRGTNSFPASGFGSIQVLGITPTIIMPLRYDQRHRGSIIVDYRFGKGDGGPILERLGINLLFTFNSGHRYTKAKTPGLGQQSAWTGGILNDGDPRQRSPIEAVNESTTPWNFNLDIRIDKTVTIFGLDLNFYVYVQNVFNTKNVINVYYATGNAYDDGFLASEDAQRLLAQEEQFGPRFFDLYRIINLQNRQHNLVMNGFDLFGTPRQIRVGLLVEM
jgi:outer membrane receptor protein involved in Fe transport